MLFMSFMVKNQLHRSGLIPQPRPKGVGFFFCQSASNRLALCEPRCPIHFARLFGLRRGERGEGCSVAGDRHGFAVFNPFCHVCKMVSQVAHGCCFHGDTILYHDGAKVNGDSRATVPRISRRRGEDCANVMQIRPYSYPISYPLGVHQTESASLFSRVCNCGNDVNRYEK